MTQNEIEALYRQYHAKFKQIATGILKDPDLAEDCVQECYLVVLERWSDYHFLADTQTHFAAYMVGMIKHKALDQIRKRKKDSLRDDLSNFQDPSKSALEGLIHQEALDALERALDRLSPEDRRFLEWRYKEKMTYQAIADRLEISLSSSKKRGSRILQKLKRSYDHEAN